MKSRLEYSQARRCRPGATLAMVAMACVVGATLFGCGDEPQADDPYGAQFASAMVAARPSTPLGVKAGVSHGFGPCGDCGEHETRLASHVRPDALRRVLWLSPDTWKLLTTTGGAGGYASSEATHLWMPQGIGVAEDDDEGFAPDDEPAAAALMRDLPVDAMAAARAEANALSEALRRALAEELEDRFGDGDVGGRLGIDGFFGGGGPVGAGPCADCMYVFVKPDDVIVEMQRLRAVGKIEIEFASAVDGRLIRVSLRSPSAVLLRDASGNVWLRFEIPLSAVEKLPVSWLVRIGGELRVDTRDADDQLISFETRPAPMDARRRDAAHDGQRVERARLPRPADPLPGGDF